jgi:hypothetical protein
VKSLWISLAAAGTAIAAMLSYWTNMPGKSLPPAPASSSDSAIAERLRSHVVELAGRIGPRGVGRYDALRRAEDYIERTLTEMGYKVASQPFTVENREVRNIEVEKPGSKHIVVIGAHYDSAGPTPGANDNGSGVAATLELAREFKERTTASTLRFVFFVNEEPPYFQSDHMGSLVYARRCRSRGEDVRAMLSLETIGYYSDERGSQTYPIGFHPGYPDTRNFLGFVSDLRSAGLLRRVVRTFRNNTDLPAQGAAAPSAIPGVGWSDHWAFWQQGYRAVMVTDTAPYRYPWYHSSGDTPDKLDYDRFARAFKGLLPVASELSSGQ